MIKQGLLLANLQEALINLRATKQRSLLALLGIVIGTGSVIGMINIGVIAQGAALQQFRDMGTNLMSIHFGTPEGMNVQTVEAVRQAVPAVERVAPLSSVSEMPRWGDKSCDCLVLGVRDSFVQVTRAKVAQGRFVADVDGFETFGVLGAAMPGMLARNGAAPGIGDTVMVGSVPITIVGILEPRSRNDLMQVDFDRTLFVPLGAARRLRDDAVIDRAVAVVETDSPPSIIAAHIFRHFEEARIKVMLRTAEELLEVYQKQAKLFTMLLGSIGCISLVVGGIGVMNVMLISVSERRKEIGIRLAVGARRTDIRQQFMVEGVVMAMIGGSVGTIIGLLASFIFALLSALPMAVSTVAVVLGPTVSAATGVFFTFFPANQAAKLDPIQALQSE